MKKKIEKEIESDFLSSLPENDLKFEKIENRIDYGRFASTKKKGKKKVILIPLGSLAVIALLAFAIPIIVIATTPAGGAGSADPAYLPSEGVYELTSIDDQEFSGPEFALGQTAEVSASTEIAEGSLSLNESLWGYDGSLCFIDGPLSETDLTNQRKINGPKLAFSFEYSGDSYEGAISFRSPKGEEPYFDVTLTDSSENTITLHFD